MYVDESGDCGLVNSPTRYFVLSGLVVHELRWQIYLEELIKFRQQLKQKYGLRLREEFHAAALINHPGVLVRIKRNDRLTMIREYADFIASLKDINLINIVIDKEKKPSGFEVFSTAWRSLIQRFENTISHHNFTGPTNPDERGLVFCDHTDNKKLMHLLRQMRHYNPVPHKGHLVTGYRNLPLQYIIEDPSFRDSEHSYFIQAVDLAAFLLYQHLTPCTYLKKRAGQNYFNRIRPILCLKASANDPAGIVRL
jgi:hypothetical protein